MPTRFAAWMLPVVFGLILGLAVAQSSGLQSGETVTGTLTDENPIETYSFSAEQGDQISLTLSSRQFDPLLNIVDVEDKTIVSNDDAAGSLNSMIEGFVIPDTGNYTVIVTSSDGTGTGDYEITFRIRHVKTITYGESRTDQLDANHPEVTYQFDGTQGDVISVQMVSDEFDGYLTLARNDFELISDDNSGGALNALIGAYVLPATDSYLIKAYTFAPDPDGAFTVSLDTVQLMPIAFDEPVNAALSGKPLYYVFDAQTGDTISVRVRSDNGLVDTMLNIQSPYGYSIGFDDDGGYVYDAEINDMVISESGEYIAVVLPASADVGGEIEVSVISMPGQPLTCDSTENIRFSDKTLQLPFQMDVVKDQVITLTIYGNEDQLASLYGNFTMDGEQVYEDYSTDVAGQMTISLRVPTTGLLKIILTNYAYRTSTYELTIACS